MATNVAVDVVGEALGLMLNCHEQATDLLIQIVGRIDTGDCVLVALIEGIVLLRLAGARYCGDAITALGDERAGRSLPAHAAAAGRALARVSSVG